MDHVRPDFQGNPHISCTCRARETSGIIKQRFVGAHLDQYWRKTVDVAVKRRNARILSVHASGQIGVGQFIQILLVNDWIDYGLAGKRRTRHRQIRPRRYEPRARGKFLARIMQPANQRDCEPGARAVAANSDVRSRNSFTSQKSPRRQRILVSRWKRMLRGKSIGDGECPHSCGSARLSHQAAMALDRTGTIAAAMKE